MTMTSLTELDLVNSDSGSNPPIIGFDIEPGAAPHQDSARARGLKLGEGPAAGAVADELSRIPSSEARDLLLFFGMGGISGAFEASPLAAMLHHQEMYAFHARPCLRCGGDKKKLLGGIGFVCSNKAARQQSEQQKVILEALGIVLPPGTADRVCPKCAGRGWIVPNRVSRGNKDKAVTARPTGSTKHGVAPSVTVDGADLATLGIYGKRLGEVRKADLACAQAIEGWFGTPRNDGGQSVRALWALTDAGRALLKQNTLGVPPVDFFENERADQAAHPNAQRRITFAAADSQAEKLWRRSCQLWNSTAPVKKVVLQLDVELEPIAAE